MKHLIVVAHPAEDSFTMGLTRAYAAELEQLGHSQRTYDLYRMGFDPVLVRPSFCRSAPPEVRHLITVEPDGQPSKEMTV